MKAPLLVAGRAFEPWFDLAELDPDTARGFERCDTRLVPVGPGFFSVRGQLAFVLPRPWGAPAALPPSEPLLTLRTLSRYARRRAQRAVSPSDLALSTGGLDSTGDALSGVQNALLIWEDAQAHGPLWRSEHRTGPREQGRPNWPRTLRRTLPLPLRHTAMYPTPIRSRQRLDVNSPLTRVHAQAVAEVRSLLGAGPGPSNPLGRTEARRILDGSSHKVFSDRMKRVFPLLLRHFSPYRGFRRPDSQQASQSLFAHRFEYVWESILATALGPPVEVAALRGRYWRAGTTPPTHAAGARLLPDLVVDLPDLTGASYRVVVDAKHYRPEKLPGTESIVKQLLYRQLLSRAFDPDGPPADRIGNAFLLPEVLPSATPARVLATHELDGTRHQGPDAFGRIVILGVNLVEAQRAYLAGRPSSELRRAVGRLVSEWMHRLGPHAHAHAHA